jgi:hypothetical protein
MIDVENVSCVYPLNRDIDDRDILEFLDLPWTKEMKYFLRTHTSQDRPKFIKNTASENKKFLKLLNVMRNVIPARTAPNSSKIRQVKIQIICKPVNVARNVLRTHSLNFYNALSLQILRHTCNGHRGTGK